MYRKALVICSLEARGAIRRWYGALCFKENGERYVL